jgi:formate hydrogenlyase subunit 6/NADH:ubiquinone oxidoreductase subunit I
MPSLTKHEMKYQPTVDEAGDGHYGIVKVEIDKCTGCNLCTLVCPANVLEMVGDKGQRYAQVRQELVFCLACDNCHAACEGDAISVVKGYDFEGRYKKLGYSDASPSQPRLKY